MRKVLNILLIFCFCLPLSVQALEEGVYQGFKVKKGSKDIGDIISIKVSRSSKTYYYSDENDKPLTGCYHIIVNSGKYVVANFSNGTRDGEWTKYMNYSSGDKVVEKGFFKNGCYDGEYVESYSDRKIYRFKDCKQQHYIAYHSNGQLETEKFYEEGKLHGKVKEYDKKGELIKESEFVNGKKHGKWLFIGYDGHSTLSHYENDIQVGEYVVTYRNGNIYEKGEYDSAGKKTGLWIRKEENGNLREEQNYLNGEYHGEVKKYNNGKLSRFEEYANGKRHGKDIWYREYPVMREERTYENGEIYGIEKYYYDNGELQLTYYHQEGMYIKTFYYQGYENAGYTESYYKIDKKVGPNSTATSTYMVKEKEYDKNGKLKSLSLLNEKGQMVVVQEYNTAGKATKTNKDYKKHTSFTLKENDSGIIDIE